MLDIDYGFVTATGPLQVRLKGDDVGYPVPAFGATWTPVVGQEVAVLVAVVGARRARVACIGPRLAI